jgi:hypothetical protein
MKPVILLLLTLIVYISGSTILLLLLASIVYIFKKKQFDLNAKEEMAKFRQISMSDSDKRIWGSFQKKYGNLLKSIKDNEALKIAETGENKYKLIKMKVFLFFKYDSEAIPLRGIELILVEKDF